MHTKNQQLSQQQKQRQKPARTTRKAWLLEDLKRFVGQHQMGALLEGLAGEEADYFRERISRYSERIQTMPKVYEQDGKDDPIAYLHYFLGGADIYITERDASDEQLQAFGWCDLGYGGEFGYINIEELTRHRFELDLHFEPRPLSECKRG